MANISTAGLTAQSILQLRDAQATFGQLQNQLATQKRSTDYGDYTFSETKRLLDFSSVIHKGSSYLNTINVVQPRLEVYENALTKLNDMANSSINLVNTTQDYNTATNVSLSEQIKTYMSDVSYYLNQKVGDRYIFSGTGTRYTTAPVQDILSLPVPPASGDTVVVSSPTLPTYDADAPGSNTSAYTKDTANIDDSYNLTYGVTSNESGIQNLILGLRWAYAATQDQANYHTYMDTARGLLTNAVPELRNVLAGVAANQNRLKDVSATHTNLISYLNNQIDSIQYVDSAEVGTKITFLKTRIEASYSVTATIAQLSITKYL